MAFPSQTPGYRRQAAMKFWRLVLLGVVLIVAFIIGPLFIVDGVQGECGLWLGVAMTLVSALIAAGLVVERSRNIEKDRALREPGTVQLHTVASSLRETGGGGCWELTSEMQIRLDSGHTSRGSYYATVTTGKLPRQRTYPSDQQWRKQLAPRVIEHFDEWFRAGASLRCVHNPTNPDKVVVFPFAAQGDRLRYDEPTGLRALQRGNPDAGTGYLWFYAAT